MHLLSITDIDVPTALALAAKAKAKPQQFSHSLNGKTLAAIFEKPSTRTKLSFQVAITQLGGHFAEITGAHLLNGHEDAHDTANTIGQYADFLLARVHSHGQLEELAAHSPIPVINGLSDAEHPCQALADLLTIGELKGKKGVKVAFVGDCNNVCNSLLLGCALTGIDISVASPQGFGPKGEIIAKAAAYAKDSGSIIDYTCSPELAVKDADAVYTDVWVSMGEEQKAEEKASAFAGFQITQELMALAKPDAIFMHCLPAQKGKEVAKEVIEGPQSAIFQQAANRLHVQKAVLLMLANHKAEVNA
ncbi:MAG: ornithine carbamoyltransferase [Candidatus Burarchaeum sp.]|nr:ornithine carbamoyltransferase [Candidatus Burarchaeum sp.]MDO8339643.1 ornithine carbamoyltransferase [Candidatus Burarchaeum sp.]